MSVEIKDSLNINYNYTAPKLATEKAEETQNTSVVIESINISDVSNKKTIKEIAESFNAQFNKYDIINKNLKEELRSILDKGTLEFDELNTSKFYKDAQTINGRFIAENCLQGYYSFQFYLKEISQKLIKINSYIEEARMQLETLNAIEEDSDAKTKSDKAHWPIDQLGILDQFVYEELLDFARYFKYDSDTKTWIQTYQNIFDGSSSLSELKEANTYKELDNLRKYTFKEKTGDDAQIKVFNQLKLLDKLKFIRLYYKIILDLGKEYYIFPNDSETGYPCIPNIKSTDSKKDTQELGALELFYVGYLIDKDGPINAISSFFEVKATALKANISLASKKIEALNSYLSFVNRGMDLLNSSQSDITKTKDDQGNDNTKCNRIPDAAWIALTYICGRNMYNLYSHKTTNSHGEEIEEKYLVLPHGSEKDNFTSFILVKADEDGMRFFLGDQIEKPKDEKNEFKKNSNGCLYVNTEKETVYLRDKKNDEILPSMYMYSRDKSKETHEYNGIPLPSNEFKLPTQLDVQTIVPSSVAKYKEFANPDEIKPEVVNSWSTAFSNKTQYINTAIDTINTDVSVDRTKVDSFDSMCSNFRSKAHDTYANITSNIR